MAKAKKDPIKILEDAVEEQAVPFTPAANLSFGFSLLNLAVSGKVDKGVGPGQYTLFVGDSSSGKTFLLLTMFAEAARNPAYDDYELLYIVSENGAMMDWARFFGSKVAARVQTHNINILEHVYDLLDKKSAAGIKYIAVVDSQDSMMTEDGLALIETNRKLREAGKELKDTYGMDKAKCHSERLRRVVFDNQKTGSILAMISQTRDNVGGSMYEPDKTRSGGTALKFYAHSEIWLAVGPNIQKEVNGKKRIIGTITHCDVKKNRVNGKRRRVSIPILPEVGVDEIGGVVDYLIEEKGLTMAGSRVVSPWHEGKSYYREELIQKIEAEGLEPQLMELLQATWDGVESQLQVKRKARYE